MLLMPRAHSIHYKSAFDIKNLGALGISSVRDEIRTWLASHPITRGHGWKLRQSWFDLGDTEQIVVGDGYIRTAVNKGERSANNPKNWAIEYIHADAEFKSRLWCTEIGLTQVDDSTVRLACMLKHAIYEGWIGEIPQEPSFSVPRLIKNIISKFSCYKETTRIQSGSYECFTGDVSVLAQQILNKSRILPFVVSVSNENGSAPVDLVRLYNIVTGNANAYQISVGSVSTFNTLLPQKMTVRPGMLRVYGRYNSLDSNARRHRFYTKTKIEEIGSDALFEQVGIALARNSKTFQASEIIRIKDVIHERTICRLKELQKGQTVANNEYEILLQEQIDALTRELEHRNNEDNQYAVMFDELEIEHNKAKAKIYRLENSVGYQQDEFGLEGFAELPRDISECMKILEKCFEDKIVIHQRAYDTASNFSGNDNIQCIRCAWRMIYAIATTLHKIVYIERINNIENEFRNRTGLDFSMNEGSQTKKDKKLMKLRCCEYAGDEYEFLPHMKGKKNEGYLRIHVAFVDKEKKILVCHCGEHIDTYGTQRIS